MNFYLFSVFVILCVGPWTIAREVYRGLEKTSAEVTEERTKRASAEARFPIINGFVQVASQARTCIQWLRRLLKALKKWFSSHPYEVKLGKCFASYFVIKISGPGPYGNNGDTKGGKSPREAPKEVPFRRGVTLSSGTQRTIFGENSLENSYLYLYSRDFLVEVINLFRHYRDFILRDNLMMCSWDYFWKKFWTWIDSTPDSSRQTSFQYFVGDEPIP